MKTVKTIMTILVIVLCTSNTFAQGSGWSMSAGLLVAPQMNIDLSEPKLGMKPNTNLHATLLINKEKNTFILTYSMTNSIVTIYSRSLDKDYSIYVVNAKSVLSDNNYTGIGLSHKIGNPSIFIEVGSGWGEFKPSMSIGALIPIFKKLK